MRKKTRRIKPQKLFCMISLVFILSVLVFYGFRVFTSYKTYNKKTIASTIKSNKTIVKENNTYIFKGSESNNYIVFSNLLFRIVKINVDNSVDIVLDDSINSLSYNTKDTYINSDIHDYINDYFLDNLDKDYLSKTIICADKVSNLDNYSCKNKSSDYYVKLLDIADYLNSVDVDSYIKSNENMWFSTAKDSEDAWALSGNSIGYMDKDSYAKVRPVVTLKSSTIIKSGTGTKEDPYIVTKDNKINTGSYVLIDEDLWIVYSKNSKTINLVLKDNINGGVTKYKFSNESIKFNPKEENTLAYYLNNTYYDSLSYKSLLKEFEICTGEYTDSYSKVCDKKEKVKVGIPTIVDMKYAGNSYAYYLSSGIDDKVFYYDDSLYISQPNLVRPIRPTISIKTPSVKGKGTIDDPYVVEVK